MARDEAEYPYELYTQVRFHKALSFFLVPNQAILTVLWNALGSSARANLSSCPTFPSLQQRLKTLPIKQVQVLKLTI